MKTLKRLSIVVAMFALAATASAQNARDPREAWLARVAATVRTLPHTEADAARMCEGAPAGVVCRALPSGGYPCEQNGRPATCRAHGFQFQLDPPLPARAVVDAFGWRDVRVVSSDVHMSQWRIEPRDRAARVLGVWDVRAAVDRPTTGRTDARVGPNPVFRVGPRTVVHHLSFWLDVEHDHPGVPSRLRR